MNIITVGTSPLLLLRNAKIHQDVLESCVREGHNVCCIAWSHDESYFMPDDSGEFFIDILDKEIKLHPVVLQSQNTVGDVYEMMKKFKPDMVITIGEYYEADFISSIKTMYPSLFKWIVVLVNQRPINDTHKELLEGADHILSVNSTGIEEIKKLRMNNDISLCNYGPDHSKFFVNNNRSGKTKVLYSSRNTKLSNFLPIFKAARDFPDIDFYVHTNFYDMGEHDLDVLKERIGGGENELSNLKLPTDFVSIKEGLSDLAMLELYNSCDIIVESSVTSATGLSLLEGMACGCVPIIPKMFNGGVIDIVTEYYSQGLEKYLNLINCEAFLGSRDDIYSIMQYGAFAKNLGMMDYIRKTNQEGFRKYQSSAVAVATKFSKENFQKHIINMVSDTYKKEHSFVIETF
jgi:glycosyltransferase involved in cell wall biosynthesis